MFICVDFDGTVVDHRYPDIGAPAPGAAEALKEWVSHGAKIILFTMRSGDELQEAAAYMGRIGVDLYGINRNPDQDRWTQSPKAYGQIYVDDAAFGCPKVQPAGFARPCVDWGEVGPAVTALLKNKGR
ncbi:hypothetical protein [Neorhizobium galegae]|uniref:hypothetical protein n=1 Tax=Neorhizobium galegae TaxID=399 RepID=UPI000620EA41|nr:hypothetical protein [Neorhizobium galegae]CDZ55102.1 Hypothetical protein NGAL_HAMBI2427_60030 [Neorhizobium galegae bv. orientalis]